MELKRGAPFYIAGIAITAAGLFFYTMPSWYYTSTVPIAFIAAGSIFYLGWLTHMGKDSKEFDNGGASEKHSSSISVRTCYVRNYCCD